MTEATVAGIIEKDGKFLLVKRAYEPFKERWCLPGGHVEEYELTEAAVIREVKEETNLDFKPKFFRYYDELLRGQNWHVVVLVFKGTFEGEEKAGNEELEIKWFSFEELNKMNLAFNHKYIIMDYIKNEERKRD